jgi:hypothetical protein
MSAILTLMTPPSAWCDAEAASPRRRHLQLCYGVVATQIPLPLAGPGGGEEPDWVMCDAISQSALGAGVGMPGRAGRRSCGFPR